ncbi:MAG: FAD-binding protein, partial [Deltaproteobacteria bacterium]|nr:FAD-binding protein [Deltaproteobacteria bacterium]
TLERATPGVVVLPETAEEVARIVKIAHREQLPFVARGAGTGLSGGCLDLGGGIIISMARMDRILEVDFDSRLAMVEPGLVNLWLTNAVSKHGFLYAPDPSSQSACTIGGNVAENSGGPHTLKYGTTTNHVLGLEVVLPDGEIVWLGGRVQDRPGYDLTGVFVGSEGTFGIATKVVVRLLPAPEAVLTMLGVFETMDDAGNTVSQIIREGIVPAALEIMDQLTTQAVEDYIHAGYPRDAGAVLLVELDGPRAGMALQADRITRICRENGAREVRIAKDEEERQKLWKGRKSAFGAYGRITPNFYVMDGVVPRTRLPEILRQIEEIGARHGLRIANVFHAGDGNLHPMVLYDGRIPEQTSRALQCGEEILRACVDLGGALTGEHGIGVEKQNFMPMMFSPADLAAMERLKQVFSPDNLCNPGKIFPNPSHHGETTQRMPGIPGGAWI